MIFVSVGMQLPFDRLISAVDRWAQQSGRADEVLAQIGPEGTPPTHIRYERKLTAKQFRDNLAASSILVAHAGIGTITQALEQGVPVAVMPRKAALGEHRNDHQLATCAELAKRYPIAVAHDDDALFAALDAAPTQPAPRDTSALDTPPPSRDRLIAFIRDFCHNAT